MILQAGHTPGSGGVEARGDGLKMAVAEIRLGRK